MKGTVIVYPSSDLRIVQTCQILQCFVTVLLQLPATDFLTDCFPCFGTDCWTEVDEVFFLPIPRQAWSKGKAQEVEACFRIVSSSFAILAVHYPRFLWVKFQPTLCKALVHLFDERLRMHLTVAVDFPRKSGEPREQ